MLDKAAQDTMELLVAGRAGMEMKERIFPSTCRGMYSVYVPLYPATSTMRSTLTPFTIQRGK